MTRRFYKTAAPSEDGLGVMLDARTLKTPAGNAFRAPTRALAEALAGEWDGHGENIVPAAMPLTQLAFAAIDIMPGRRGELARSLAKFIQTDLVCHRAGTPEALVLRQAELWDPIVDWSRTRFHIHMPVVTGVIAAKVPPWLTTTLEWEIDDLDDFRRTALAQAVTLAGSVLIGFALLEGRLDAEQAFEAAALDDLWSLEHWGEDGEARARLERLKNDLRAVARFIQALSE